MSNATDNIKEVESVVTAMGKLAMALLTVGLIAWGSWLTIAARETDKQMVQVDVLQNELNKEAKLIAKLQETSDAKDNRMADDIEDLQKRLAKAEARLEVLTNKPYISNGK